MDEMYSRVEWFKPADAAIVNLLASPKKLKLTPSNIALNIDYSRGYISERCRILVEAGVLDVNGGSGDPTYSVTDIGQDIADRELEADDIRELDPTEEDED